MVSARLLSGVEPRLAIGIGASGLRFAQRLVQDPDYLPIETVAYSRNRAERQLQVAPRRLSGLAVAVDDIMVSGRTLSVARQALDPMPDTAVVGMAYASRSAFDLSGFKDLLYGVRYARQGGGVTPLNALASLQQYPDRLASLADRYFTAYAADFMRAVQGGQS